MSAPSPLSPAVRRVRFRVRTQRAVDAATLAALPALLVTGAGLVAAKLGALHATGLAVCLGVAAALVLSAVLWAVLRRVPEVAAARLLDRAHGTFDRVASALAFAALPDTDRTAFMRAAIDDGATLAGSLRAARAVPFHRPRDLAAASGLALAVGALALVAPPRVVPAPVRPHARHIDAVRLHPDDVAAFRDAVSPVAANEAVDADVRRAAGDVDDLLARIDDGSADRDETLRRLAEIEARLDETDRADADALREALQRLADPLSTARETEAAAEALRDADARRAAEELRRTAEALRHDPPDARELARVQEALRRAAEQAANAPSDEQIRRASEELERMQNEARESKTGQSERERRLLQQRQQQVQRMRDQRARADQQRRRLEHLQRNLHDASEHMRDRDQSSASQDLDQGAQQLDQMADAQMSQEERERLREQVEQLRELIRQQQQAQQQQQQQGGQGQQQRSGGQRSGSQGQSGQQAGQMGQGQMGQGQQGQNQGQGQGQGQQGQSRMDRFVMQAGGQGNGPPQGTVVMPGQGQGGQPGGSQGGDQPGGGGQRPGGQGGQLGLAPNGQGQAQLMMPGQSSSQGQGDPTGDSQPGQGAGAGHDPTTLDDPTRLGASHQNAQLQSHGNGQGPTRSQVIDGAAERGFASQDYERVYTDYEHHAEEVLEQDQVPSGYRFYVRRYFQLIRPRENR